MDSNLPRKVIWLIKRDFRLYDNEALSEACRHSGEVLPVYCFESLVYQGPDWGQFHSIACKSAVSALRKNLRHHGGDIYFCSGDLLTELKKLRKKYNFTEIYAHEETGLNHTFNRDKVLRRWCNENQILFKEFQTNGVVRCLGSRDDWERLFKQYMNRPLLPVPKDIPFAVATQTIAAKTKIPTNKALRITIDIKQLPDITEANAHRTLKQFLYETGYKYRGGISSMNTAPERCSRLSYDLAWGTISLRTAMKQVESRRQKLTQVPESGNWEASLRAFKSRLYWHAHFIQKLETEVAMEHIPQNRMYVGTLPVVEGDELARRLLAWKQGRTGFPAIDAAMRYYQKNGWLNFRSRAMIVSFACHALRIPWQTIVYELAPFMMDYVPGIHVAQIQMQAGVTGTNIIRVYSPMKQMEEKDPDAVFIKSQISELDSFSAEAIANFQDVSLGDYPAPIIDFKKETKIMKDELYGLKKSAEGKKEAQRVYQLHGSRSRIKRS
jgi:deoxyribodipyrimidine photo-lyase